MELFHSEKILTVGINFDVKNVANYTNVYCNLKVGETKGESLKKED